MAFLNFMKKREGLPADIDLDMPPEPPKMMGEEISAEEPIDEELMPIAKKKKLKVKAKEEKLPELPPLPEEDELGELPELPPLTKEKGGELPPLPEEEKGLGALPKLERGGLPPLPEEEKGLGALPKLERGGLPPLPEEKTEELGGLDLTPPSEIKKEKKGLFSFLRKKKAEKLPEEREFPEMPPLPEAEEFPEIPPLTEEEEGLPPLPGEKEIPSIPPIKPEIEKQLPKKEVKVERAIKRFITINDFKQIRGDIGDAKIILKDIGDFFVKLGEVKGSGDKEYAGLYSSLKDIQTKIMFVDKTLFKEQSV